ncbi:conserved hypothetical protein [Hyphomonas neptunium ATCC 15444]|uniref:DUF4164 family protein n=3 Tax=Hyphomonas TaxID=85 RepID=Q0BWL5_HYPNA|nr:DUF4164 family protein [Hyphomonas hirschiana]ABI77590.1 conserved hypothetical protein [Hyphomonas neptunium ATCC 15444]KCZ94703.1 hypothetical protein HHI_07908 [Hyphomonas hirschiana VP5]
MQILDNLMNEMDSAATRLDAALKRLEGALEAHLTRAGDPAALRAEITALVEDRSRLAEELDDALAREQELQALADEASDALGAAIQEVRAALSPEEEEPGDGQG